MLHKEKIISQYKKNFSRANKKFYECFVDKCNGEFKTSVKGLNNCTQKFKGNQVEMDKCYATNLLHFTKKKGKEINRLFNKCSYNKCRDAYNKKTKLDSRIHFISKPYGKQIVKLQSTQEDLFDEYEKCKKDNCDHIYPLDKLKKEKEICNVPTFGISIVSEKVERCKKKYNIDENEAKINNCGIQNNCNKIYEKAIVAKDMWYRYYDISEKDINKNKIRKQIKKLKSKLNSL